MPLPSNLRITETSRLSSSGTIVEPITLTDAKNFLKIPLAVTADDALVTDLISDARTRCEQAVSRTFVQASYQMVFDTWPPFSASMGTLVASILSTGTPFLYGGFNWEKYAVVFPFGPLISVDSISYIDPGGNTVSLDPSPSANNVRIVAGTPGWMIPAFGKVFPITQPTIGNVTIDFTCGMITNPSLIGTLAPCVRSAIRYICGLLYFNRSGGLDLDDQTIRNLLAPVITGATYV